MPARVGHRVVVARRPQAVGAIPPVALECRRRKVDNVRRIVGGGRVGVFLGLGLLPGIRFLAGISGFRFLFDERRSDTGGVVGTEAPALALQLLAGVLGQARFPERQVPVLLRRLVPLPELGVLVN